MSFDFTLQLGRVAQIIDRRVDTVVKKCALDIYTGVTKRNPVDTGYSRAAWNIGIDRPDDTLPGAYQKGAKISAPDPGTKMQPLQNLQDVSKQMIYITNAVHYVPYLEGGSSKQAPAGMVLVTVEAISTEIDEFVRQAAEENPI